MCDGTCAGGYGITLVIFWAGNCTDTNSDRWTWRNNRGFASCDDCRQEDIDNAKADDSELTGSAAGWRRRETDPIYF